MFKRWKWEQVALLAEDGQNFPEYHAFLKDLFISRSIQVPYDRKMPRQAKMVDAAKVGTFIYILKSNFFKSLIMLWSLKILFKSRLFNQ